MDGAAVYRGDKHDCIRGYLLIIRAYQLHLKPKDTGLIFEKYKDYHFDKSIITGNDIIEYMKVVSQQFRNSRRTFEWLHITHGQGWNRHGVRKMFEKRQLLRAIDDWNGTRSNAETSDEKVLMGASEVCIR